MAPDSQTTSRPTCDHCGGVIGVYEPAVVVSGDGDARETSRAADPTLESAGGGLYHRACYLEHLDQP